MPDSDRPLDEVLAAGPRLVAVLAHARDPGNAGTVLRTADAAGADAVLLTGDSVDPYNPKCVRASAGSLFHLPVVVGREVAQDLPARARPGCGSWPPTGAPTSTWTRPPTRGCSPRRPPGCSATRPRGCRRRPAPWPTWSSGSRSTGGPRAQPGDRRRGLPLRIGLAQRRVEEAPDLPVRGAIRSPVSGSVTSSVAVPPSLGLAVLVPS